VFEVPVLIGADLRGLPWQEGRCRRELLARAFDVPLEVSPLVQRPFSGRAHGGRPARAHRPHRPDVDLRRRRPSRRSTVKDGSWYEREAWRCDRR